MPRTRSIKHSFFMNEDLSEIEPFGRLLFIGLWTLCDREGKLEDRPKRVKASLFPYDKIDVDKLLTTLHNHRFIIRYTSNGLNYIKVFNFITHQNPHKNETKSDISDPGASESIHGTIDSRNVPVRTGCLLDPDHLLLDPDHLILDEISKDISCSAEAEPHAKVLNKKARAVLEYLNHLTGRNFRDTESTLTTIKNRLREYKHSHVIKAVIKEKCEQWRYGEFRIYLRPKTLFARTNFDNYYGEIKKEKMDAIIKYAKENPNEW